MPLHPPLLVLLNAATPMMWAGFFLLVLVLLALDLGVFHRKAHVVSSKEALGWTVVWITVALAFNAWIYLEEGHVKALEFFTGYVIEKSLSVDNLFVMVLVFTSFGVPKIYQHRVLFWGIFGALVMRGTLILVGTTLISRFHFIIYVFGAFLIYTGLHMLFAGEQDPDPQKNKALRLFRRLVPTTDRYDGQHFLTRVDGRVMATPLLAALVVIEAMDLVFAVDSIPAVFAVTLDPFIVFTSNVFAILGLRSLYFLLANVVEKFVHLKVGLAVILTYVGVKMLITFWDIHIPVLVSLGVILAVLLTSVLTSIVAGRRAELLENAAERKHSGE